MITNSHGLHSNKKLRLLTGVLSSKRLLTSSKYSHTSHPCRWSYHLDIEGTEGNVILCTLRLLSAFFIIEYYMFRISWFLC